MFLIPNEDKREKTRVIQFQEVIVTIKNVTASKR